jgi:hypothetical protein
MTFKLLTSVLFLCCYSFGVSQTKNEQEERVKVNEFPKVAQEYFNKLPHKLKNQRFYRESDGDKLSFETKFKYKKQHYSVEFDANGILEDVEVLIKKKDIPKVSFETILNYFNTHFEHVRFIKIQKQYINASHTNDLQFINFVLDDSINKNTHFEIIADIKSNGKHLLKEFTFKSNGEFEKSRPVSSSSYEYALY